MRNPHFFVEYSCKVHLSESYNHKELPLPSARKTRGKGFSEIMDEVQKKELQRIRKRNQQAIKRENRVLDSNLKKGCAKIKSLK